MADNNAAQIVANINKAAEVDIPIALGRAMEQACLGVERAAKANIKSNPTGTLRSSITHKVLNSGSWDQEGVVGSTAEYAPYVECGTGVHATMGSRAKQIPWRYCDAAGNWHTTEGQVAKPFLKPARDENISAILKCFEGLI